MPRPPIPTAFITEEPDLDLEHFLAECAECPECSGTGKITALDGQLTLCPDCDGTGLAEEPENDDDYGRF